MPDCHQSLSLSFSLFLGNSLLGKVGQDQSRMPKIVNCVSQLEVDNILEDKTLEIRQAQLLHDRVLQLYTMKKAGHGALNTASNTIIAGYTTR